MMKLILLPITVSLLSSNPLSKVLFPEDNEVEHSHQICSDGEDYCEHLSSYPASKIAKALQKEDSAFLRNMLKQGNDNTNQSGVSLFRKTQPRSRTTLEFRPRTEQESGIGLRTLIEGRSEEIDRPSARTEPELEYEKVCQSLTEDISPQRAKNKKGQYRFIVNGGEGLEEYIQTVTISKCLGAGLSCNVDSQQETECKQEFIEHKLVSLDQSGKQLEVDTFPLPSGCSCYKRSQFEY